MPHRVDPATVHAPRFFIRPLEPGDRDRFAALFARLSPESRRRRFFSPKPHLSEGELTYFTDVDHVRHEAMAAVDVLDGAIVGVARYAPCPDRSAAADVAVEVADDLQRRGIGVMLVEALLNRARENGLVTLVATTLWGNRPARALARRTGFAPRASHGGEIELELAPGRGLARECASLANGWPSQTPCGTRP